MVTATESQTKAWRSALTVKDDDEGAFEAVFTTFGVVDKDGDVIDRGAFDDGARVPLLLAHRSADLPIGMGTITTRGDEGLISGRFFTETAAGREARATVKALTGAGITQELSHGFLIKETREPSPSERAMGAMRGIPRIQPIEVSLVLRGAGENTRVLSVKEEHPELTLEEQYALLRERLNDFVDRIKGRAVLRQSQGRPLSKASLALLRDFQVDLDAIKDGLVDLLASESSQTKHPDYDRLRMQLLRVEAGV